MYATKSGQTECWSATISSTGVVMCHCCPANSVLLSNQLGLGTSATSPQRLFESLSDGSAVSQNEVWWERPLRIGSPITLGIARTDGSSSAWCPQFRAFVRPTTSPERILSLDTGTPNHAPTHYRQHRSHRRQICQRSRERVRLHHGNISRIPGRDAVTTGVHVQRVRY